LDDQAFLEVPTPCVVPAPAMEPFLVARRVGESYLRTSPEFALKRVLAAGLPRVYELGPCWREEEAGPWHADEFLMLEWYRVGGTLDDLMADVEALVTVAAAAVGAPGPGPFQRWTVREAFRSTTGLDLAYARAADLSPRDPDWDEAFFRRFVQDVEPRLPRGGLFLTAWPASQAALAKVQPDPEWPYARRFEAYLDGVELANAFDELLDPQELERRWANNNTLRQAHGLPPWPVDAELLAALPDLPPTAGIALGVDRLVALVAGWDDLHRGRVGRQGVS
jgi:lysyl-tRNA synthetase class 2